MSAAPIIDVYLSFVAFFKAILFKYIHYKRSAVKYHISFIEGRNYTDSKKMNCSIFTLDYWRYVKKNSTKEALHWKIFQNVELPLKLQHILSCELDLMVQTLQRVRPVRRILH